MVVRALGQVSRELLKYLFCVLSPQVPPRSAMLDETLLAKRYLLQNAYVCASGAVSQGSSLYGETASTL